LINKQNLNFSFQLIHWQRAHGRHSLPWQNTRDPYAIWLSEIMLQQTRVTTVIPYYQRFLQCYPDIKSLSLASLDEVLALWSGLGYYSRGRNLHKTAHLIVKNHQGKFPCENSVIKQLPGIGRSTAAAIQVFAFGKRCAILDGNVKRILTRYFGVDGCHGERKSEILLWKKAEELLPENKVNGDIEAYSQGLMDLGSTICTRNKPKCTVCPIHLKCTALQENKVDKFPTARPRKSLLVKETIMLMIIWRKEILLERRPSKDIWGGLWCLPEMPVNENISLYCNQKLGIKIKQLIHMPSADHSFTHFKLRIYPRSMLADSKKLVISQGERKWIPFSRAMELGIPAPVRSLLNLNFIHK
jgi:A/G-specific adenine glycosylase